MRLCPVLLKYLLNKYVKTLRLYERKQIIITISNWIIIKINHTKSKVIEHVN